MRIEVETKFNISDVVRSVGAEPGAFQELNLFGGTRTETRYIVLGILVDTCPGGTQIAYAVRGVSADGGVLKEPLRLGEQELAPSEPFPIKAKEGNPPPTEGHQ